MRETIEDTVKKIKSGDINVKDLVKEHLKKAHESHKRLNSFISILDDYALKKAELIDKRINEGNKEGKLLGIPFTVKDLYLVKGTTTTFGSKHMQNFIAPYTATVVKKLEEQGAILIGKCNCDPWGFGGSGENSGYGATKHPLDESRSPGGSSSGSAASLADGVGFFAMGTDTGGSVRQPAAMCGLYGYKPTYGRNSRYGISAMGSSFDTPAFFTTNIEDLRLLEEIMEGNDSFDATTHDLESVKTAQKDKKVKNIGILKEFIESESLNEDIRKAILNKIENLKNKDYKIKEISIPHIKYSLAVYYILVPAEISSNRARYDAVRYGKKVSKNYEENMIQSRSKYFEDEVKRRIMIGTYSLSAGYADKYYQQASKVRTLLKKEFAKAFEEVDIIISPTTPSTAFKLGEKINDPIQMYLADIYTVPINIVGVPALNIPIGKDSQNLPIGMQYIAPHFRDEWLFNID